MAKISVIVPIYNTEKYLKRCLSSLENQTEKDIEFILINDASTDHSFEIMESYQRKDSRFRLYFFKKNEGVSIARNYGLEQATGKYIGFVDSDDFIDSKYFEVLGNILDEKDLPMAAAGIKYAPNYQGLIDYLNEEVPLQFGSVSSCTHLFQRELIGNDRFLEHTRFEDTAFNVWMHMKGQKNYKTNQVQYCYTIDNPNSFNRSKKYEASLLEDRIKVVDYLGRIYKKSPYAENYQERVLKIQVAMMLYFVETIIRLPGIREEDRETLLSDLDVLITKKYGDFRSVLEEYDDGHQFIEQFQNESNSQNTLLNQNLDNLETSFREKMKTYSKK